MNVSVVCDQSLLSYITLSAHKTSSYLRTNEVFITSNRRKDIGKRLDHRVRLITSRKSEFLFLEETLGECLHTPCLLRRFTDCD